MRLSFEAELWLWPGGNWHFIALPDDSFDVLGRSTRGFGSLPVQVTIGETTWNTSVFPDKKRGTYVLPVKADVRAKEGLAAGDVVQITLELH